MSWLDNYRKASFRGAAFYVSTADADYGRRLITHEHAQRDIPYTEDNGRKARRFTVDGYLLGPDYHLARDALIDACEGVGAATLVHPYRGELTVSCDGLRVSESEGELAYCRISMTFIEAGEASFPRSMVDSVNAVSGAAIDLETASLGAFVEQFLTEGFPGFVLQSAVAVVHTITGFLSSPGFTLLGSILAISRYNAKVKAISSTAGVLARNPQNLGGALQDVFREIRLAFGSNAGPVLSAAVQEFQKPWTGPVDTPSRQQEKINYDALQDLVRLDSLSEAAIVAVEKDFDSLDEARDTRNELDAAIDAEQERTTSDEVYTALGDLHAEVATGIPQPDQQLPQLVVYAPNITQPSLKVAQTLYADASRADEIATRNRIRHPGFLVGREPLEVLADG
ncbi:DNA circularization protein [Pseudomonas schmalbachii]|uniref:DNA circularization N-terminal domain-containing protein n=1 Tax=Pseudomonas schmalbachii TaxID=2816993 RepID=A0ABS3TNI1_9PSED|nr:DNA circularization N-terminal domain-containing protein [Pseudomonas schmalbachii]MBO3274124.1 DNA circularization N-terminal domain-containing protein [Pseudomonas schmalbachii]